jgi:tricorn protease
MGNVIYFRSDRNGEFNVFSFDLKSKALKQLTQHNDFPVLNASAGDDKIIYEQAGYLHLLDPKNGKSSRLTVGVAADLRDPRPRYAKGASFVRDGSISPTGARLVLDFRGEIVTLPAEKGDMRNLTNTTAVHERHPAWSPDGKQIAYFSMKAGNTSYTCEIKTERRCERSNWMAQDFTTIPPISGRQTVFICR